MIPTETPIRWQRRLRDATAWVEETVQYAAHDWSIDGGCNCRDEANIGPHPKFDDWPHWLTHVVLVAIEHVEVQEYRLVAAEPFDGEHTYGEHFEGAVVTDRSPVAREVVLEHLKGFWAWLNSQVDELDGWAGGILEQFPAPRFLSCFHDVVSSWIADPGSALDPSRTSRTAPPA